MVYSGSYALFLVLHLISVIFVIGPLALATGATPRLARQGAAGVSGLRAVQRTTVRYAYASIVVPVLGTVLVAGGGLGELWGFGQLWVSASYVLYVVAVALTLLVAAPGQTVIADSLAAGRDPGSAVAKTAAAGGLASLAWVAIVVLMVVKPGAS